MMRSTTFRFRIPSSSAGLRIGKEADDDKMKPDSEYAHGRRTGKVSSQDLHHDWEIYEEFDRVL